jgi:hypothetical protein
MTFAPAMTAPEDSPAARPDRILDPIARTSEVVFGVVLVAIAIALGG